MTRQRRQGKEEAPALGHVPFWFKPVSAFGLLDLTTFISSSPELAMPSTLAPDRIGVGSRRTPSRDIRPLEGEDTLSQELRTVGLLWPHVLVGYQWSHTGLRPGRKTSHNRYIRSFVSQPPWNQGDPRCSFPPWPPGPRQGWAAGSDRFWLLELRVSRTFLDQLRPQLSGHGYPARRANSQRQQSGSKGGQDQLCSTLPSGYDRMYKTGVANDRDGKAKQGRIRRWKSSWNTVLSEITNRRPSV